MPKTGAARKVQRFKTRPIRPGSPEIRPKGKLLVIGGHEDQLGKQVILRELARLVGNGKLVITTVASELPAAIWDEYERSFRALGIRHIHHLKIEDRADAESPRAMTVLKDASLVFFTGGDQLKITSRIGDTPVYSRIFEMFINGGTVAGTSAGASVMSETMIVGGNGEQSFRIGNGLHLAPGLGFAKDLVIDQHFAERGRISRLLGVVAQNPRMLGLGIDENTAVELDTSGFRVFGEGAVYVVDGAGVTETNVAEEDSGRAVSIFNVKTHVLTQGDSFDIATRTPTVGLAEEVERELGIGESKSEDHKEEGGEERPRS
jgi:cyanophycinase